MAAFHCLQEMFGIIKHDSIPGLKAEIVPSNNGSYNTRQIGDGILTLPIVKSKKNMGFIHKGIKLWNTLPLKVKNAKSKASFSLKMKEWVLSNIPV